MEKVIVCIASYFKGSQFIQSCKEMGNHVILITSESLKDENWPWESIDEIYYMPEIEKSVWNLDHFLQGFSFLMRKYEVDAVVALDDFDVEKAAMIRETFRIPGMGQTTHRYFRDKLAMRQKAKDSGVSIPEFSAVFNDAQLKRFMDAVPAPWVLKPRSEASAMGIKKLQNEDQLWSALHKLGEERLKFLLESFKPGDVYHVDCLVFKDEIVFSSYSKYLTTPMEVSHDGGVFRSVTLTEKSKDALELEKINRQVLKSFGIKNGATHSEFIKGKDGTFYFLETSSRIGGAYISDMIEAATGINIWKEWAKLETALLRNEEYAVQPTKNLHGGLLVALAKDQYPDTQNFESEEVDRFLQKDYHIGIVFKSDNSEMILKRLEEATEKVTKDLLSILPPKEKAAEM